MIIERKSLRPITALAGDPQPLTVEGRLERALTKLDDQIYAVGGSIYREDGWYYGVGWCRKNEGDRREPR